ncbi:DUF308 domain-containing protein [Enterococcus sp. 5H]|uniref:DUF308 domain-containing protein n=1 Tax=Enterococcus sp. 5H TaxID=1229490 RepID=UPI002302D119|nr:DUF308 domain-containing protein [Enterococcus sp. 5H]MDA9470929.1 putative membrane protein [Enterococcus sp. 5H]
MDESKYLKIGSFILGLLFIRLSFIVILHPITDLIFLAGSFSLILIIKGIMGLYSGKFLKDWVGLESNLIVFVGLVDILLGCFCLFHIKLVISVIPYIFASWLSCYSMYRLFKLKEASKKNLLILFINSIGVIVGLFLFVNPEIAMLTVVFSLSLLLLILSMLTVVMMYKKI